MLKLLKGFDRRLAADLRRQRRPITQGLVCAALSALLTSSTILLVKFATEAIERTDLQQLAWSCIAVVIVFAVKYTFTRGQVYFLAKAATLLSNDLRSRLFSKLQRLPVSYYTERRTGAIQSVLTNDVSVYQLAVNAIRDSIEGPVKALSAFITVVVLQWQLSVVSLIMIPVMAAFIQRNGRKMRAAQASVQQDLSDLQGYTQEAIQGVRVVKAFNAEERTVAEFNSVTERLFHNSMRAARTFASLRPLTEFIGAIALAIVLYLCGLLAQRGMLGVSDIAALVLALDAINQGVKSMGYVNNAYNQVQAAAERIYGEVLEVPEEHAEVSGSTTLAQVRGRIEFDRVSFTYPDGTVALSEVSFVIEPGTSLALVGPSGAGKSTVADLVQRFYDPTSGRILLDGVDYRELDVQWLRSQIGVVPQTTFLFAGTLDDNIRLGAPSATGEQVEAAAKAAHAADFIERLPQRYQTPTGERGAGLSGGEMQRVSIARALVRDPALLVLDEATSNLDAVSEQAVQTALDEIMRQRTTLFIAHRLTTAARAHRILVLSRGEVVEMGSHTELLERNGVYAAMYRAFGSGVFA